jgi:hypothetical protein
VVVFVAMVESERYGRVHWKRRRLTLVGWHWVLVSIVAWWMGEPKVLVVVAVGTRKGPHRSAGTAL